MYFLCCSLVFFCLCSSSYDAVVWPNVTKSRRLVPNRPQSGREPSVAECGQAKHECVSPKSPLCVVFRDAGAMAECLPRGQGAGLWRVPGEQVSGISPLLSPASSGVSQQAPTMTCRIPMCFPLHCKHKHNVDIATHPKPPPTHRPQASLPSVRQSLPPP